ncbi:MAG: response regulator [Chitinophagaceae bacterium]|nr:response regulator [Chitinophagaceae bacterium]
MQKAVIIDDERLARNELKRLLRDFPDIEVAGEASNSKEGVEVIEKLNPDLVFLDIQMPGETGFDMLAKLDKAPQVIFVTAYDEYALKAFEINALDYLMKPVEPKRLADALHKLKQKQEAEAAVSSSRTILTDKDQVFVKDGDRCWFVKLSEVRMFESVGNYAKIYFGNNKPLILKSLNALEERLDDKVFFRANRKYIINMKMIEKVETYFNGGLLLELTGGEKVEVSRRQAVKFRDTMSL